MKRLNKIEELLEGLAVEGTASGAGTFTIAPDQLWKGLGHAVGDAGSLPRFALRWLVGRDPRLIEVDQKGSVVSFTAHLFVDPPKGQPEFDYSGRDIDLARTLVCALKSGGKEVTLIVQSSLARWTGLFHNGKATDWTREENSGTPSFRLQFSISNKRAVATWKKPTVQRFQYCPVRLDWQGATITRLYEFDSPPLIWRRLVPNCNAKPKLNFRAPQNSLDHFVCTRPGNREVIMSLSTHQVSRVKVVYKGDLFELHRPGFLPGYEIIVGTDELLLDMQGLHLVANRQLQELLLPLREEAYDMTLQLFHCNPPPSRQLLAQHLVGIESILVFLLTEKRFVEGATLVDWVHRHLGDQLPPRAPEENYTFYRTAALLCENANRPHLALNFEKKARKVLSNSRSEFGLEALLVDAHLEAKSRRGLAETLTYSTRSQLHLKAVRCHQAGDLNSCYRLLYILLTSGSTIDDDQLEIWFQAAELARGFQKWEHLKVLLKLLKRSRNRGTLELSNKQRARANSLADLVSKPKG